MPKNQLQLVFQQFWTGLLKDWLQLVATSSVASCLKFGQKDWTGLDFKTLRGMYKNDVGYVLSRNGDKVEMLLAP